MEIMLLHSDFHKSRNRTCLQVFLINLVDNQNYVIVIIVYLKVFTIRVRVEKHLTDEDFSQNLNSGLYIVNDDKPQELRMFGHLCRNTNLGFLRILLEF